MLNYDYVKLRSIANIKNYYIIFYLIYTFILFPRQFYFLKKNQTKMKKFSVKLNFECVCHNCYVYKTQVWRSRKIGVWYGTLNVNYNKYNSFQPPRYFSKWIVVTHEAVATRKIILFMNE